MPIDFLTKNPEDFTKAELFAIIIDLYKKLEISEQENRILREENQALRQEVQALKQEVKDLKERLNKNSNNSSKPPSSDGYGKKNTDRSLRQKTNKPRGGQPGHEGATLKIYEHPDRIENLPIDCCEHCGESLQEIELSDIERRQVIDIPQPVYVVTEYIGGKKHCPCCSGITASKFPPFANASIQYGPNIQAHSVYLNTYQAVSYERMQEFWKEIYGLSISQTSLMNFVTNGSFDLESAIRQIESVLVKATLLHSDETGVRINGKLHWIHSLSNLLATLYMPHKNRGDVAMNEMNILPKFIGKLVHDHWKSYLKFKRIAHYFCNAHHLRELIALQENEKTHWSKKMIRLLLRTKALKEKAQLKGKRHLPPSILKRFHETYQKIIEQGISEYPPVFRAGKRGKLKKAKGQNLLERLKTYESGTLGFIDDFQIPFDNNLAERDIRMVKLKAKVSGCFRSMNGAKYFCRIRSYISTMKKQGFPVYNALKSIFDGNLMLPNL